MKPLIAYAGIWPVRPDGRRYLDIGTFDQDSMVVDSRLTWVDAADDEAAKVEAGNVIESLGYVQPAKWTLIHEDDDDGLKLVALLTEEQN